MTDDAKQLIQLQLYMLKQTMKENGVIFGFMVDKSDVDNSKLCFIDKKEQLISGFCVSLTELNMELL